MAMERLKLYIRESYNELVHKVTWPTREHLLNTTVTVVIGSIIFTLLIALMDVISNFFVEMAYGL